MNRAGDGIAAGMAHGQHGRRVDAFREQDAGALAERFRAGAEQAAVNTRLEPVRLAGLRSDDQRRFLDSFGLLAARRRQVLRH